MPDAPEEDEKTRKIEILEILVFLHIRGDIDLRFGDESAFSLEPNIPYGWIKKGQQRGIPSKKGGKLNVFGLMNLTGALTSYQTTQNVNSQTVIDWIDNFAKSIQKLTIIVLDNAPWHKSQIFMDKVQEWKQIGLFIIHLPPYSPHLNPIEILWKKIKYEWLKPKDYRNKEVFHAAVNHILKNYNSEQFKIEFKYFKSC